VYGRRLNPCTADLEAFVAWIKAWPNSVEVVTSPLRDAWYDN